MSKTHKIRVVHLVNFDLGLKIHVANYLRYQKEQGYDVSVITHPGQWITHDTAIQDDIPVKVIPFEPRISPLADLKTLYRLVRYFRQQRFDIVHTSTVKPGLLGRLAARIAGVPVIIHTHRGLYLHDEMSPLQHRFFVMVEKIAGACCHSILSQNEQDIETAVRLGLCPPDKIRHLGNGIEIGRFYPGAVPADRVAALRSDLGIPPDHAVIGIVARLVREKGIFEFLEAAHLLKFQGVKARFLAIGASQKGKSTSISPEEKIRELGLEDDVMLLGHRDDVPALVSLMDVVVLPSYAEGIPRILMESAAMAKPIVASRVRGNIDVVIDGETGILVPVRDAAALADGIKRILDDPDMAAEMGRNARQRALTHFDERLYFYRTDAEYRRLLRERMRIDPTPLLKPIPSPGV